MSDYISPIYSVVVSLLLGYFIGAFKKVKRSSKAEKDALGALLRNAMFKIHEEYRDATEVPANVQEEMDNLYKPYHELGFNSVGTKIHDEIMKKPTKV